MKICKTFLGRIVYLYINSSSYFLNKLFQKTFSSNILYKIQARGSVMLSLGEKVKIIRNILCLKQENLASEAKISRSYLANVETQKTDSFPYELIVFLQKKFGINPDYFLDNNSQIFIDPERAILHFKTKSFFNVYETFYILSQIQNLWSYFDEFLVREEFANQIIKLLQKFSLCDIHEIASFEKAIKNKSSVLGNEAKKMIFHITNYILEKNFNISKELHKELQNLIFEWGIYIFIASAMYEKHKLIPLESSYIDLEVLKKYKKIQKKLTDFEGQASDMILGANKIKLQSIYNCFVLNFVNKWLIEFSKRELFGFISAFLNIKDNEKKKILDYEILYTAQNKTVSIKQRNIAIFLTFEDYHLLKNFFESLKKRKNFWNWLQACYIEEYGFA